MFIFCRFFSFFSFSHLFVFAFLFLFLVLVGCFFFVKKKSKSKQTNRTNSSHTNNPSRRDAVTTSKKTSNTISAPRPTPLVSSNDLHVEVQNSAAEQIQSSIRGVLARKSLGGSKVSKMGCYAAGAG